MSGFPLCTAKAMKAKLIHLCIALPQDSGVDTAKMLALVRLSRAQSLMWSSVLSTCGLSQALCLTSHLLRWKSEPSPRPLAHCFICIWQGHRFQVIRQKILGELHSHIGWREKTWGQLSWSPNHHILQAMTCCVAGFKPNIQYWANDWAHDCEVLKKGKQGLLGWQESDANCERIIGSQLTQTVTHTSKTRNGQQSTHLCAYSIVYVSTPMQWRRWNLWSQTLWKCSKCWSEKWKCSKCWYWFDSALYIRRPHTEQLVGEQWARTYLICISLSLSSVAHKMFTWFLCTYYVGNTIILQQ